MSDLLPLMVGLPIRPTHGNLSRFGGRCRHADVTQVARACDLAALNLADLCEVVPYDHALAWGGKAAGTGR